MSRYRVRPMDFAKLNTIWIIDLGPDGGEYGGRIVASGTPEQVARKKSYTADALRKVLA